MLGAGALVVAAALLTLAADVIKASPQAWELTCWSGERARSDRAMNLLWMLGAALFGLGSAQLIDTAGWSAGLAGLVVYLSILSAASSLGRLSRRRPASRSAR